MFPFWIPETGPRSLAGQVLASGPYELDNAEPPVLLGEDAAANPVESVLHALAGCLTNTMVYHAAARGIHIESVNSELEGDLDLRGFLGMDAKVRKGFHVVRVRMQVRSEADAATLAALAEFSPSPTSCRSRCRSTSSS